MSDGTEYSYSAKLRGGFLCQDDPCHEPRKANACTCAAIADELDRLGTALMDAGKELAKREWETERMLDYKDVETKELRTKLTAIRDALDAYRDLNVYEPEAFLRLVQAIEK